jgi:hypothetical protein
MSVRSAFDRLARHVGSVRHLNPQVAAPGILHFECLYF